MTVIETLVINSSQLNGYDFKFDEKDDISGQYCVQHILTDDKIYNIDMSNNTFVIKYLKNVYTCMISPGLYNERTLIDTIERSLTQSIQLHNFKYKVSLMDGVVRAADSLVYNNMLIRFENVQNIAGVYDYETNISLNTNKAKILFMDVNGIETNNVYYDGSGIKRKFLCCVNINNKSVNKYEYGSSEDNTKIIFDDKNNKQIRFTFFDDQGSNVDMKNLNFLIVLRKCKNDNNQPSTIINNPSSDKENEPVAANLPIVAEPPDKVLS